jgi:hypothetical protein
VIETSLWAKALLMKVKYRRIAKQLRLARWALLILLITRTTSAENPKPHHVFPFLKGTKWTYAGSVKWIEHLDQERSHQIRWTSEVVDAFDHGEIAAALLKGGVWDLAWYQPGKQLGDYAVIRVDDEYYLFEQDAATIFAGIKNKGRSGLPKDYRDSLWFETPLSEGDIAWPDGTAGADGFPLLVWVVDKLDHKRLNVPGVKAGTYNVYNLILRSNPDHQIVGVAPGVGIVSYIYSHHGTLAEADVHLVSVQHRASTKRP